MNADTILMKIGLDLTYSKKHGDLYRNKKSYLKNNDPKYRHVWYGLLRNAILLCLVLAMFLVSFWISDILTGIFAILTFYMIIRCGCIFSELDYMVFTLPNDDFMEELQ